MILEGNKIWTGWTDAMEEGKWMVVNNKNIDFFNLTNPIPWKPGEPNGQNSQVRPGILFCKTM